MVKPCYSLRINDFKRTAMTIKTLAAAVALTLIPVLAFAECSFGKQQAAMNCAEGSTYDHNAGKCIPTTS